MSYRGPPSRSYEDDGLSDLRAEGREPGGRRKKIAGYLRAANELRQSYTQSWGTRGEFDATRDAPGAFPDATVASAGDEELIVFPSYARRHVKIKPPTAVPGQIQETSGTGRDSRDTIGAGDAEFWREQWEKHENDKAIVDVDVRGWMFTPLKGQLNRKQRLMVALARQLVGLPAPSEKTSSSKNSSRSSSPTRSHQTVEEEQAAREAAAIIQKGQTEAEIAGQGRFSEQPSRDTDGDSLYAVSSRQTSPSPGIRRSQTSESLSSFDGDYSSQLQKRTSWPQPANMSTEQLGVANNNLMTRLKPFMAAPVGNSTISAFFYDDKQSRQRTILTDASGHFSFRAALDFVPTHVRIIGSEKLSVHEEVKVIDPKGVSLVSDIDDTVRHSAITKGAREIFRNAFIRDLGDLTIEGVKEWYGKLFDMGVQLHYVSNSPWQLFPVIKTFFGLAGLPQGSFHLKQYSGMLQGIFEPVAERKKATMDRIMRDFPERRFILIGDSGEADLEVYTDVVLDNPGRIIAIYIRDVTTPPSRGFFDPSTGPLAGSGTRSPLSPRSTLSRNQSTDSLALSKRFSRPADIEDDDDELKAAILASLQDMEKETAMGRRRAFGENYGIAQPQPTSPESGPRPALPPRRPTDPPAPEAHQMESSEDLIDFSDDPTPKPSQSPFAKPPSSVNDLHALEPQHTAPTTNGSTVLRPPPPTKPNRLRSPSNASTVTVTPNEQSTFSLKPAPPPKPRKPSSSVRPTSPSPLHHAENVSSEFSRRPQLQDRNQSYRAAAKQKLSAAYNALPSATFFTKDSHGPTHQYSPTYAGDQGLASSPRSMSMVVRDPSSPGEKRPSNNRSIPAPLPRRGTSSYPGGNSSNRMSGSWNPDPAFGEPQLNKKEETWRRRWKRAKDIMDKEGVMLRTWRVGTDVMDECVSTVERELHRMHSKPSSSAGNSRANETRARK